MAAASRMVALLFGPTGAVGSAAGSMMLMLFSAPRCVLLRSDE